LTRFLFLRLCPLDPLNGKSRQNRKTLAIFPIHIGLHISGVVSRKRQGLSENKLSLLIL